MAQAIRERQVQEYTELIYTSYRTYIERIVADGVASGEFRTIDTAKAASMVLAMIEGLILQWFFDRKAFDLDAAYGMCADFVDVYLVTGGATERGGSSVGVATRTATPPPVSAD